VLQLPVNVASQISASVSGLRAIGINARGIIDSGASNEILQSDVGIEVLPPLPDLPRSLSWAAGHARRYYRLLSALSWADVVHWHFGELVLHGGFDLRWTRFLKKPGVAEFWGTDIRVAEIEASDNLYFARYMPIDYQEKQTSEKSERTQALFAGAGFECLVADESMKSYIHAGLFSKVHLVRQRIMTSDYASAPPDPAVRRPLVVHSPSNPKLKGTEFVLAAVEKLRPKLEFEFRLIQNMPRSQALSLVAQADVFVDQLILGSHGLAALEAMAFGKPVVCFIKPSLTQSYPADLPIVSANPDDLQEILGALIRDGSLRQQIGVRSRAYVEKHHDAIVIARQLKEIYAEICR